MKQKTFKSWGDAEADRLWREMYEAEMALDDIDLLTDSPKLQKATDAAHRFNARMEHLQRSTK